MKTRLEAVQNKCIRFCLKLSDRSSIRSKDLENNKCWTESLVYVCPSLCKNLNKTLTSSPKNSDLTKNDFSQLNMAQNNENDENFTSKCSKFNKDSKNALNLQPNIFDFSIIAFELVAVNSPYYNENTPRLQSTC